MLIQFFGHLKKFLFLVMAEEKIDKSSKYPVIYVKKLIIFKFHAPFFWRTQFWKGTTQGSFQQSLVEIGIVVSEEKIFFKFHAPFF